MTILSTTSKNAVTSLELVNMSETQMIQRTFCTIYFRKYSSTSPPHLHEAVHLTAKAVYIRKKKRPPIGLCRTRMKIPTPTFEVTLLGYLLNV